jgi:peroxiredoxin
MSLLTEGTTAPEFTLSVAPDQKISLADYRGRNTVLVFYPADWSPVCGDQLAVYNQLRPMFQDHGAEIVAISVDSVWCHAAFARERKIGFPLLADFEPKGAVARSYGAYRDQDGFAERALFVIDAAGTVRWSYLSPLNVNPGADGILDALESMKAKV